MLWMRKYLIVILLMAACLLLIGDIVVRSWFSNGLHLVFDDDNFNNIVTPIATIISIGIYTWTLLVLIKQNKVIHSQNLKPNFQREYDSLIKSLSGKIDNILTYKPIDLPEMFWRFHVDLGNDKHYKDDIRFHHMGNSDKYNFYEIGCSYKKIASFLQLFAESGIYHYDPLAEFIKRVKESDLMEDDKEHFLLIIKTEVVNKYIYFIDNMSYTDRLYLIPISNGNLVEFKPFAFTAIRKHYDLFVKELYPERLTHSNSPLCFILLNFFSWYFYLTY